MKRILTTLVLLSLSLACGPVVPGAPGNRWFTVGDFSKTHRDKVLSELGEPCHWSEAGELRQSNEPYDGAAEWFYYIRHTANSHPAPLSDIRFQVMSCQEGALQIENDRDVAVLRFTFKPDDTLYILALMGQRPPF
jgi:hypothetical protein